MVPPEARVVTKRRGLICVFAKPPVAGQVKTRLGAELGHESAALLARAFLRDTWALVTSIPGTDAVLATTDEAYDFGLGDVPTPWPQGAGDLGERIERVLVRGLERYDFVIAVGADTPGLPAGLLTEAALVLRSTDAVIGPADDGGFYLLGLVCCPKGLLDGVPWSSPRTFLSTVDRLKQHGFRIGLLSRWFDVDTKDQLDRLESLLTRGAVYAPHTAEAMRVSRRGEGL